MGCGEDLRDVLERQGNRCSSLYMASQPTSQQGHDRQVPETYRQDCERDRGLFRGLIGGGDEGGPLGSVAKPSMGLVWRPSLPRKQSGHSRFQSRSRSGHG
jgi:hypothetical protein